MMPAAYKRGGKSCTREAFYAVACDPRRSASVEACAGAGKTWMLVSRILRALLEGARPDEILAITFTRKAAGEMRQRLQEWLQDFAQARPDETQAEWLARLQGELQTRGVAPQAAQEQRQLLADLFRRLLQDGRPVQIRTFHSWFITLLGSAPLSVLQELDLPLRYELLEDDTAAVARVWRPFLQQVAADASLQEDYIALVQAVGRSTAHKALEAALQRRVEFQLADAAGHVEQAVAPFESLAPELAGLAHPSDALQGDAARARWLARAKALGTEKNKTPRKAADAVVAAFECADSIRRLAMLRKAFFVASGDRLNKNLEKFEAALAAEAELQSLLQAQHQHEAWLYHQRMMRLTRLLIACYGELKREHGWVDMNDVERAALVLLGTHELSAWVQERLDVRVRHLLIDEFQDTNPLQWQALHAWLSGYAGAGGGRDTPSVFIVGDPKQSIYRFRRADPVLFAAAQDFVVDVLGGERLSCDHTRRNAPTVLNVVNTVMQQLQEAGRFDGFRAHSTELAAGDAPGQVATLPLVPRPEKPVAGAADAAPTWRDSLHEPREEPEETLRTLACRQAARWIAARLAAGVAPEQIMVLARKRMPLGVLQAELRALHIASEQVEDQALVDQPAAADVLALVDALVSPDNNLALARALKSPLFGLDDADLTQLALAARANAGQSWLDVLPQTELPNADARALHADLMRYRGWLLQLPPHDALQAIYGERDVLALYAAAAPASERDAMLGQLRAVLTAALNVDGGRFLTAYAWLRALRRHGVKAPRHEASGRVRLLTVHGAKGLEADEVLLLDAAVASGARRGRPAVLIDWPATQAAPERLVFAARDNDPPADAKVLQEQEDAAQAREELNALYVAMTRARQRLVLAGFEPANQPSDSWWLQLAPHADALPAPDMGEGDAAPAAGQPWCLRHLPEVVDPALTGAGQELAVPVADDDASARVGEAMHWLLEHADETDSGWRTEREHQICHRFALDQASARRAAAMARTILQGEGSWAWSADQVLEAFNEVEIVHDGKRLRIDRLVHRRAIDAESETWWVLDYKSAWHPEQDAALREQLEGYRAAVKALHPGQAVRAGFLNGNGDMVCMPEA